MATVAGQWYMSTADTTAMLNLEVVGRSLAGHVLISAKGVAYTMRVAADSVGPKVTAHGITVHLYNRTTRQLEPIENHQAVVQQFGIPAQASAELTLMNDRLEVTWQSATGAPSSASLASLVAPEFSAKPSNLFAWEGYKRAVSQLDRDEWVFRGQAAPWSLRTCFHRRGRCDLIRYDLRDMLELQRVFVSSTNTWLNPYDPLQYASLLTTAQHHGYPTPFLDWTRSPYIAAYFALRDDKLPDWPWSPRVLGLNTRLLRERVYQTQRFTEPTPTLTVLEAVVPFWNPRAVQQQSVTTLTNVDNIEIMLDHAQAAGPPLLMWFDLDKTEREPILDDLEWMGVTESLLFPGMEGSFRTLARSYFPR